MEELLSRKILQWCEKRVELSQERRATIQFGLEMGVESVLKTFGILAAGALFHRLPESTAALVLFCGLRFWAGGIHCRTSLGCFGFMLLLNLGSILWAEKLCNTDTIVLWVIWPILLLLTIRYAPMNSRKNTIVDRQIIKRKKAGACIWVLIAGCLMFTVHDSRWRWIITLSILLEVLTFSPVIKYMGGGNKG